MSEPRNTGRVSAPERVYRELRRAILEGAIAPGERLTTMSLAERLGVSRTPVRAALVRLQADGLVDNEGGRSARVRPLTVDEVEQAYDVAMGLEGVAVCRLAQHADDVQKDDLLQVVSRMEAAAEHGDRAAWVDADERFHQLLAEFTDNPLLQQVMDRVETIIGRLRFMSLHVNPQGAATSAHEHRSVVDAIRDGEPEQARRQHHDHWERVRQANIGFLREGFSGSAGYLLSPLPLRRPQDGAAATD